MKYSVHSKILSILILIMLSHDTAAKALPYLLQTSDADFDTYVAYMLAQTDSLKEISINHDEALKTEALVNYYQWLKQVKDNELAIDSLAGELSSLTAFEQGTKSQAAYMAQSLLQAAYGQHYTRTPMVLHEFSSGERNSQLADNIKLERDLNVMEIKKNRLINAQPNPFTGETKINFTLNSNVKNADLRVIEVTSGKTLKIVNVKDKTSGNVIINDNDLSSGVYAVELFADNLFSGFIKVVVIK